MDSPTEACIIPESEASFVESVKSPTVALEDSLKLKASGNAKFGQGLFSEAIAYYSQALDNCPQDVLHSLHRSQLLSNRAAAYIKLAVKENYELALADCTKALELHPENLKALFRRAQLHELMENLEDALTDYKHLVKSRQNIPAAKEACERLQMRIEERDQMKSEMLSKLKDLGNLVLKPFGLSTNNFKLEPQDSGGYSVKFEQSPSGK